MDESRRKFLKQVGYTAAGAGCTFPLLAAAGRALETGHDDTPSSHTQWGLVIDVQKCMSDSIRQACMDVCRREHNVPQIPDPEERIDWIWEEKYEHAFPDQAHHHTAESLQDKPILVLCNHCTNPPCVKVCPTKATWKREQDGIVMMDMHRCIGCRYCVANCPYGARSFNWRDPRPYIQGTIRREFPTRSIGVVEKCDFCAERVREGRPPACVEAAQAEPGGEGALTWGDLSDPDSDVSRLLRREHTICRRPSLGTGPNVFYIV